MNINKLIGLILLLPAPLLASDSELCNTHYKNAEWQLAAAPCQKASESGDHVAQTILGELYDSGDGVTQDSSKAAHWWGLASNAGHQPARNLLAMKHYYGGTVFGPEPGWKKDYAKAYKIWHEDAVRGVATSQFMLGVMYKNGEGVKQDYAEAWAWFKISLQGGYKLSTDLLIELSRAMSPADKQRGKARLQELQQRHSIKQRMTALER